MRLRVELDKEDWEAVLTAMMYSSTKERNYVDGRVFNDLKRQLEEGAKNEIKT